MHGSCNVRWKSTSQSLLFDEHEREGNGWNEYCRKRRISFCFHRKSFPGSSISGLKASPWLPLMLLRTRIANYSDTWASFILARNSMDWYRVHPFYLSKKYRVSGEDGWHSLKLTKWLDREKPPLFEVYIANDQLLGTQWPWLPINPP